MAKFRKLEFADGETHEKYLRKWGWTIVPLIAFFLLVLTQYNVAYPLLLIYHFLWCEVISPDLDQIGLTKDDGDAMRTAKKFKLGLLGIVFVNHWNYYAYIIGFFGGHRSWASHGWIIGTIGRMLHFNIPFVAFLFFWYTYGVANWDYHRWNQIGWNYFYMDYWLAPYLLTQFIAWNIGDGIHIYLDKFGKGKYYDSKRSG